jgi:hypothetical protein
MENLPMNDSSSEPEYDENGNELITNYENSLYQ